jgi:hypothetical protein
VRVVGRRDVMGGQFIVGIFIAFVEWLFPGSVLPKSWDENCPEEDGS